MPTNPLRRKRTKLQPYEAHQAEQAPEAEAEPSGVACTQRRCKGEMMVQLVGGRAEDGYARGRAGEPGAVKNGTRRALCGVCGWRGWV